MSAIGEIVSRVEFKHAAPKKRWNPNPLRPGLTIGADGKMAFNPPYYTGEESAKHTEESQPARAVKGSWKDCTDFSPRYEGMYMLKHKFDKAGLCDRCFDGNSWLSLDGKCYHSEIMNDYEWFCEE